MSQFKATAEQTITHALGNITIDEDDLSDEYDFMDDDDEAANQRRARTRQRKGPFFKYKEMLQDLADRKVDEIPIDLDDVAEVPTVPLSHRPMYLLILSGSLRN